MKPHPSPWVLSYSINDAAGATPSPARAAAMTWLPGPAPTSPPTSVLGGTCSPGNSAGGLWLSRHPPAEPSDVAAQGNWGSPETRPSIFIAPKAHPKSTMSISICMAPKTLKQRARQSRVGSNFALRVGIYPFYYIRIRVRCVLPTPHGISWAQSKFKTANLILNCN